MPPPPGPQAPGSWHSARAIYRHGMKKKLAFALLLFIAAVVLALDFHRGVRVKQAVTGLLPLATDELVTFRSTAADGRWVMVEKEDTQGLLRAYNANRLLYAEHTTPRLPFGQGDALALAPIAILRTRGVEHAWHLAPRNDHLLQKYLELSTAPAAGPDIPDSR